LASLEEVRVPKDNVNDESVTVLEWLVEDAERVEAGQPLATVETSKSVFEIEAPCEGYVKRTAAEQDDVAVGSVIGYIGETVEDIERMRKADGSPSEEGANGGEARFSRKALELIQREGLEEMVFAGKGLVREKDVRSYLAGGGPSPAPDGDTGTRTGTAEERDRMPDVTPGVKTRREKLPRGKRTEIQRLRSAFAHTLPSSVTVAVPTRDKRRAVERNPEIPELLSATMIFEAARLLRKYPPFNAVYDRGEVCYYEEINVGFAIDGDHGLKVPVIRNADRKSVREILGEQREMVVHYIENRVPLDSLAGGTFTISNLSGEGVETFAPIINQGQSAILGVGGDRFPAGETAPGSYNLILAFDHQLAEGRLAARFLKELRERLVAHEETLLRSAVPESGSPEPYCNYCLKPLTELQAQDRYLIETVGPGGKPRRVCELCIQGW